MRLRPIRIEDRPYLRELLQSTDEFTSSEVACAVELIEDAALRPSDSGYWGVVAADDADLPLAYAIYGVAQLPLDIVSKGRFEKSEPTIVEGEDLDVPTYLRKNIKVK